MNPVTATAAPVTEPASLARIRRAAWDRYRELSFPGRKSEEWRYTDLRGQALDTLRFAGPEAGGLAGVVPLDDTSAEAALARVRSILGRSRDRAGVVVQLANRIIHMELDPYLAARGVVLCSLAEAASTGGLLENTLLKETPGEAEEKLWALHLAAFSGGYFLQVPPGVEIDAPVHAFRIVEGTGEIQSTHSVISAERESQVTVIDEFLSECDRASDCVSLHGATVLAQAGAAARYVAIQRFGQGVRHFGMQHVATARDGRTVTFNAGLGSDLARLDARSRLDGPGSNSQMLGLWVGDGEQHFDHHTLQHHAASHAGSDLLFKGALTDKSRGVFRGLIRVDKNAQLTDAYQTNRNLLLSPDASAVALPNLEIEADDVRCSHGATIGQVDEDQMFYLTSRGLTRSQAERLLVFGFLDEVLSRLPVAGVRDRVSAAIVEKINL